MLMLHLTARPFNYHYFFLIKCKNWIDQKVARQACGTSWKPAVHMDIYIQAKENKTIL
jgi:hypothetical protein